MMGKFLLLVGTFILVHSPLIYSQEKIEFSFGQGTTKSKIVNDSSSLTQTMSLSYFRNFHTYQITENLQLKNFGGLRFSNQQISSLTFQENDRVKNININSFNFAINPEISFHQFSLGFNLDLIGLSTGMAEQNNQRISVPTDNLFLIAKNDRGTLNSQTYFSYHYKQIVFVIGTAHNVIQLNDHNQKSKRQKFFDQNFFALGFNF